MNAKTILMISLVLNAGLLCSVAYLTRQMPTQSYLPEAPPCTPERVVVSPPQTGDGPRFGPEFQVFLASSRQGARPQLLNLETGQSLVEPTFDEFGRNAKACVTWLKSNGLDISGCAAPGQPALYITYYLAIVPVPESRWKDARAQDVLASPELAASKEPKRCAIEARDGARTFFFRTQEGAVGILRLDGARPEDRSVGIRYKLVE